MATEHVDITLENLLNLALGTPEIGAVNFNFLHEVIQEILKHIGISKKLARVSTEIDYRLKFASRPSVTEEKAKESIDEVATNHIYSEAARQESLEIIPTKVSEVIKEKESQGDLQESEPKEEPRPVPSSQSRKHSIIQSRRSSHVSQRLSQLHHGIEGSIADAAIVRTMERRDSKTPAGDMWHVLNINRRVEAAEAAIQGMTNLIDTINADVDDLKNTSSDEPEPHISGSISKQEQDIVKKMAAKLKSYDGKFTEIDNKVGNMVAKTTLNDLCTKKQVKELIQENLNNFEPAFPVPTERVIVKEVQVIKEVITKELKEEPKVEQPLQTDSVEEVSLKKTSTQMVKKRDSKESRTRIAYQEVSGKMLYLEQEINKAKYKVGQLELELGKKLELSAIEGKSDKIEVSSHINDLSNELQVVNDHVSALEKSYRVVSQEVSSLISQNDEFTNQQQSLAKAMKKLERNIEDMTDNFHRSQTEIVRRNSTQTNMVDDTAITKIRGTIFDMQEQQTKFQHQIDVFAQDSQNKEKVFEDIFDDIKSLEEGKIDKEFVKKELECKADKSSIMNKLNRDQFDACISEIDRNIQGLIQKIEGAEAYTSHSVEGLQMCIDNKLDRDEAKNIHNYIDARFKAFKPKVQETRQSVETAAASRKQLLKNCNCISCDRPVDIPMSNDGVTLPYYQPLPGMKSMRPVNTFDLQTIRQHMQQSWMQGSNKDRFELAQERDKLQKELLQLCGVRDLDELADATNRACGGGHTLIEQHRRNPTKPPMLYREEHTPFRPGERQLLETEVRGRDGHIYKGRMQSPIQLPNIQRKEISAGPSTDKALAPRVGSPIRPHPSSIEEQRSGNNFSQHKVTSVAE